MTARGARVVPPAAYRVLFFLRRAGGGAEITRRELAGTLGLTEATVKAVLKRQVDLGNIVSFERRAADGGSLASAYFLTAEGSSAADLFMSRLMSEHVDPARWAATRRPAEAR